MTFSVFAAICILGCDLLIYVLFQWTLGESGHRNRRRGGHKQRLSHGQETELLLVRGSSQNRAERLKALPHRKTPAPTRLSAGDGREARDQMSEEAIYRRRVAAFAVVR
jgi:hypothetical protein